MLILSADQLPMVTTEAIIATTMIPAMIDHSTVSKRHAFMSYDTEKEAYKMGDAGSTNGTFLNGQSVEAGDPVYVRDGNVVSFGDCDYMFFTPTGFIQLLKRLKKEEEEEGEQPSDDA